MKYGGIVREIQINVVSVMRKHRFHFVQAILIIAGLGGAAFHSFPLERHASGVDYPIVDLVGLAYLGLIVVAVLLPNISEITLGESSLKFRDMKAAAGTYRSSLDDLANLVQNWSTSVLILWELFDVSQSSDESKRLFLNYIRDRMGEAVVFLSDKADDEVRIALWMYDAESKAIRFAFSNGFEPTQREYALGEGMIGRSLQERRQYNEADLGSVASYKPTRSGDPPYRAVLCRPLTFGGQSIAMLTIDKRENVAFDALAEEIAAALGEQCLIALKLWSEVSEYN